MSKLLQFPNRESFRNWLVENGTTSEGVWLLFGKKGGPKTLKASEALEEALCFGWIDGLMESLDSSQYKKYFAHRRAKSNWSEKNKKLVQVLIEQGRMAQEGINSVENAKRNGEWDTAPRQTIDEEQIEVFKKLISQYETAYSNLLKMSLSVQKTYTGFYLDAKSPKTQQTRLEKIVDRLNKNLKPM